MTKKSNVKLFKKTFQKKGNVNNNENQERPLTATLEKPQVLNIKFINTIDMSLMRKELLCITNLCRAPFRITKLPKRISMKTGRRTAMHRPLSLPSCDDRLSVISKRTQRSEASEDSWESEESSSVSQIPSARSKKINRNTIPSALSMGSNQRTKIRPEKKISKDPNNNQKLTKLTVQIPDTTNLSTDIKKRTSQSIKLPEPCKTCGRPDQPERFHSHPATPLKPIAKKATMEIVQLPTKSSVQKPFAMKYKSKVISKPPPLPAQVIVHSPPEIGTGKVLNERPKTGKGPKTLMCYLCGREFGTTSLKLHEPKCTEKWERENASLPPSQRRKLPKKPEGALTKEEWNDYASKTNQAFLIPCENCSRTFLPDRLLVHQRSCKSQHNMSTTMATTLQRAKSLENMIASQNQTGEDKKSLIDKIKFAYGNLTVEPIFFFYILPSTMASLATQNLNLEKACRVNLELDKMICDGLAERNDTMFNKTDEIMVQKLLASMYAWKNVIQSLFPALLLLFFGSWSDRHRRRRPFILIPMIGEALSCVGFLICTFFYEELSAEYSILFESLPPAVTGGWFTVYMGLYSYVSQITSPETRTSKIGTLSIISNVSYTVGMALSGVMLNLLGFYGIYLLSLSLYITGIIFGYFKIKEEKYEIPEKEKVGFLKDFFSLKHVADTFRVAFKSDSSNRKTRICVIMILVMIVCGPLNGEYVVGYLFMRYKFQWDEVDFSIYATFNSVIFTLGTIFSLTFFSKYLKLDDALLGTISSISKVLSAMVYAFAPNAIVFYLGGFVEMFNGTSFIAMRSIISKLVSPDELGKINSLFGVSEALMPLLYGPTYSLIYKSTIDYLPGAFYLFGGILTIPAVLIFLWLYFQHIGDKKEKQLEELNIEQKKELLAINKEINIHDISSKLSSDSNNSSLSRTSSPSAPPTSVECSICGRLFGQKSIKIHEPQCLKKQQYDNNQAKSRFSSNHNKSPLPTVSQKLSPNIEKPVERPASAKKSPMFPCYLCGRLFSVNSIYIHEPQCLKKWKTENEKLPPNLRRPEPIKPDIKFTPDGKIDYDATSDSNWQTHLNQLVACDVCGRTFNPERVEVHQRSCKG